MMILLILSLQTFKIQLQNNNNFQHNFSSFIDRNTMQNENITKDKNLFKSQIFQDYHIQKLVEFQNKMAQQIQNCFLNIQTVTNAIAYLKKHPQLGIFMVRLDNQKPIGTCMATYQNKDIIWIMSVYVQKEYRNKGHFISIFNKVCQHARQKNMKYFKLYVAKNYQAAKSLYRKLGLKQTGKQFYSFDYNFATKIKQQQNINQQNQRYIIQQNSNSKQQEFVVLNNENFIDILSTNQKSINENAADHYFLNSSLKIYKKNQNDNKILIGQIFYFTEYNQWQFGLSYYVQNFFIEKDYWISQKKSNQMKQRSVQLSQINQILISYFLNKHKDLPLQKLRYLISNKNNQIEKLKAFLPNGEVQHYETMEMQL